MKKTYEAWSEENGDPGSTFISADAVETMTSKGLLSKDARLVYRIEADTFEEAMAVHYIKQGWSPFVPAGKACKCPNGCGAIFYPEGSGECPNCGRIC
jgi:hypothetical protein